MPELDQLVLTDYILNQFSGKICFSAAGTKLYEQTEQLYGLQLVLPSRLTGEPLPAPIFPAGLNLDIIQLAPKAAELIPTLQTKLDELNIPVMEYIAIYDYDRYIKNWELTFQKPESDLTWEQLWRFQHKKAIAWAYCQETEELMQRYSLTQIKAAKDIIKQFDLIEVFRKQAILRLKLEQLRICQTISNS
jgi:hypothetical protein